MTLTIDDWLKSTYEPEATVAAFQKQGGEMGQFPLPNQTTVIAAEMLSEAMEDSKCPNLGAVGVAEYTAEGLVTYVAVSSGFGTIPQATVDVWNRDLEMFLENAFTRVAGMSLKTHAIFYTPLHKDAVSFVAKGVAGFNGKSRPLRPSDVDEAVHAFGAVPDSAFGTDTGGKQLGNMAPVRDAVQKALSCAVGARIGGAGSLGDHRLVVTKLKELAETLKTHTAEDHKRLAAHISALAVPGGHADQFLYAEEPKDKALTQQAFKKIVNLAWRVADLNRFCAEPKLFTYVKSARLPGALTGQVAFWWDSSRRNNYKLTDDPGIFADFMLPCSSCQERSGEMVGPQGAKKGSTRELPTHVLSKTKRVRQRRHSIGSAKELFG